MKRLKINTSKHRRNDMTYEEQEFARRTHAKHNRTITMESKDNVWAWRKLIEDNSANGKMSVERWGRDCDQFESTSLTEIDATLDALATLVEDVQEYAEGPWSLTVMTQEEVANWERKEHDHGAEKDNY
jgi:ribosomal protein S10